MYKKKSSGWSQHLDFMGLDILCLELALFFGALLQVGWQELSHSFAFWSLCIGMAVVDLMVMVLMDAYHSVIRRDSYSELKGVLTQTMYVTMGIVVFVFLIREEHLNMFNILVPTIPFYAVLCFNMRVLWKEYLRKRLHLKNRTGMLVVAGKDRMKGVLTKLVNNNYNSYRFVGVAVLESDADIASVEKDLADIMQEDKKIDALSVVATRDTLIQYLINSWVDEVYLDIPGGSRMPVDLINEIMGMGITVHVSMNEMDQIEARHKNVEWVCGQVAITTSLGYVSGRDLLLKRIMDIIGGSVGALITLLLTVILGPFIYAASPGPIFFRQTRIGENGRQFSMYKFRSMYMDAEKRKKEIAASQGQEGHLMFKMEHDPRIIGQVQRPDGTWKKGIGGWIRDLSLDEFPQFFNVLKGDMSLVGTRPPTLDEWEHYEPYHRGRMSTKPGITGLWQTSGRSRIRDFNQVVQLDREYIENWSLLLDCKILLRTVWVVLTRKGAM